MVPDRRMIWQLLKKGLVSTRHLRARLRLKFGEMALEMLFWPPGGSKTSDRLLTPLYSTEHHIDQRVDVFIAESDLSPRVWEQEPVV